MPTIKQSNPVAEIEYDEDSPNAIAPKPASEVTQRDLNRIITRDSAREAVAGRGQDDVNLRSLQQSVDSLEAKAAETTLTRAEKAKLEADRKSLAWQQRQYQANAEVNGNLERRDANSMHLESNKLIDDLTRVYEQEFTSEVKKIIAQKQKQGLKISAADAESILERKIGVLGAAQFLPRSTRFAERNGLQLGGAAPAPAPAPTAPAPKPAAPQGSDGSFEDSARAEYTSVKSRVDAALKAGENPAIAEMARLDALGKYLSS